MSLMSEFLSNIVTTIAGDIKALWAKLNGLTKADVGLGNVDNTADANKSVASAGKLTTARNIAITGGVTGNASFDGSSDITIDTSNVTISANKLTTARTIALTGDATGSTAFDGTADVSIDVTLDSSKIAYASKRPTTVQYGRGKGFLQDADPKYLYAGSKVIYSPDAAWYYKLPMNGGGYYEVIVETSYARKDISLYQIAYSAEDRYSVGNVDHGAAMGFFFRRIPNKETNTPSYSSNNYIWRPISTSLWTYQNITTEAPNMYIGNDGVLMRSTNIVKPSIPLSGTIGSPTNLVTTVSHGQTPANIKNVAVVVDKGNNNFVLKNQIDYDAAGVASFSNYFNVEVTGTTITITAHKDATAIHSRPFKLYVDVV